jgi:hypothetical protein
LTLWKDFEKRDVRVQDSVADNRYEADKAGAIARAHHMITAAQDMHAVRRRGWTGPAFEETLQISR